MIQAIRGAGVLVLLSMFFAYLLAPAVAAVRRRLRVGRRKRPASNAVAIVVVSSWYPASGRSPRR